MESELKYKGFLKINSIKDINKNGVTIHREVMSRSTNGKSDDCVAGLLYDTEKELFYLVKQYRAGAREEDRYLVEVVAGTIEGDEDPKECFIRESMEEVGFECDSDNTIQVGCFYTSPGGTTERIFLFLSLGTKVSEGGGLESENEDIEVLEYSYSDLNDIEVLDLKTMLLINYKQDLLNGL